MEQAGYFALIVLRGKEMLGGLVPDELIVMNAGAQAASAGSRAGLAFAAVYAAVVLVTLACYGAGTIVAGPLMARFGQSDGEAPGKKRERSALLGWIISLSLFIPVARQLVPFWAGLSRFSFGQCLLAVLPSSLIWTLHYFMAGYWFSDKLEWLEAGVYTYGKITCGGLFIIGLTYIIFRRLLRWGMANRLGREGAGMEERTKNREKPFSFGR
ncbi:hypothetical protein [Brevibacillus brevis]|uniref:DedA family protein n=1 Tax=Brevibacillus brevis TaxID=1393 RepID=A0ABY9SZZ3_BREBE|nr:hypothetical protein [Brevibacillus brevis]WNC13402.1 hypothetical protein RGB73_22285 [Brevibacillus brevis]